MPSAYLDLGPVRASGPISQGLVDVHFDGERLRLTRYTSMLDVGDRYKLVLLAASILLAVIGAYLDGVVAAVFFGAAAVALGLLLLFFLVEAVLIVVVVGSLVFSLFTRAGRAELMQGFHQVWDRGRGFDVVIPEAEITLMDNVYGAVRVHLVLYTGHGEVHLAGWFWRRRQLEKLQKALANA